MPLESLDAIDWNEIVLKLESFATSESGKSILRNLKPLESAPAAQECFQHIFEVSQILHQGKRPFMESLDLTSYWFQRLEKEAVLKPLEIRDVRHFCVEIIALKEIFSPFDTPWIQRAHDSLMNGAEPLSAIEQILTQDGSIRTDASETLYNLYNEKKQKAREVEKILDRLVHEHELETVLQDKYVTTREGRWVLPVRSGMQGQFDGLIHASSQSKQTVFMEPQEIIPINNRLREVEDEIEKEIERLLNQLTEYLATQLSAFKTAKQVLLKSDVLFAKAQLSTQLNASAIEFSESEMELVDVRHPLLSMDDQTEVISNSVSLDRKQRILLLSGPNAGGKTVLLKSVGLAAHMARCGLPICAENGSKMPFFKKIHIGVGDSQSVDEHLSTFAAHLKILSEAASVSGFDHLLLIDEICGSTDPEEGTALARSFIETYASNEVFAVVTSHLGPLKIGWTADSGVINGSLEYNSETGRPTYQFLMGIPGQSLAIQTAKRVGVQPKIIETAIGHLSPEMKRYQQTLEQVEEMKAELRKLKSELQQESKEARKEKSKYHALVQKFEKEKDQMLNNALKRAERKIDRMIEYSKVDEVFKKHTSLESMKQKLPEVVKASGKKTDGPEEHGIETLEQFKEAFPPGTKVYAPSIGRDAVIQGEPTAKGEVPVLSNSMRLMIQWQDLKPPRSMSNPTREVLRKTGGFSSSPLDNDRNVDLRGLSVEEAIGQLEIQLDTAASHQEERVKVVHGHGTEALKRAVRSYLSRSIYVKKWQAGDTDGVTWIELKD